jgi:hypothetical protein
VLAGTNNSYRIITLQPSGSHPVYSVVTIENAVVPLNAASICGDSKNCYFFKDGSIYIFDLKSLLTKAPPPGIYFDHIKTLNGVYAASKSLTISYKESKNITISTEIVSAGGKRVFYEYSISKRGTENWQPMEGGVLNLVNPGYGAYKVSVRARTSSSNFCEPVSLKLTIATPWWATWWAVSLSFLLLVSSLVLLLRYRVHVLLRKKEKEHDTRIRFMKSEYKALNALMNPHFIFNTINNLQTLFNSDDKRRANKYLKIFSDLVRQNMQNVSKDVISLRKEIDLVTNYLLLEKLRFEKLNYTISIDEHLDLADIMIPPLLIQPLVENSIKHGILPLNSPDGHLYINVKETGGKVQIEIRDNGVGLQKINTDSTGVHQSFGLSNIRERIRQLSAILGKDLLFDIREEKDDVTGKNRWTIVTVTLAA